MAEGQDGFYIALHGNCVPCEEAPEQQTPDQEGGNLEPPACY